MTFHYAFWALLAAAAPPALTQGADCQDAEGLRGVISNHVVTSLTVAPQSQSTSIAALVGCAAWR
jgi:hypothetical protein